MLYEVITRIIRIFESVDQRLAAIDDFRYQLEKRVADTVRYMDKTTPGMAARLSRLIAELGKREEREIPRLARITSYNVCYTKLLRLDLGVDHHAGLQPQLVHRFARDAGQQGVALAHVADPQQHVHARAVGGQDLPDHRRQAVEDGTVILLLHRQADIGGFDAQALA